MFDNLKKMEKLDKALAPIKPETVDHAVQAGQALIAALKTPQSRAFFAAMGKLIGDVTS